MKTFAGFWRDGARVRPTIEHCDVENYVVAKDKKTGEFSCAFLRSGRKWEDDYWLDTTTPTELTPQEAFECYKTVYPDAKGISKTTHGYTVQLGNGEPIINWGDTTEYPPKQKWRVPTDADKGKECRCKHRHDDEWRYGRVFITEFEGKYLAKDLADNSHRRCAICEVLE
jgi:hypothetical protein